ncbi:MAG: 5-formyltetrahydrofolate cyclo-ligase [Anaerolineaceae bacterium]|nr:MAG: 5-formyltetrahydrofolate cyclo-ligase [Anaerolineaceae bacterium]
MERDKQDIRQQVWQSMTRAGVARSPGAQGRIPNFHGAEGAANRLAKLGVWRNAQVLKCNPDSPQRPVRERALRAGKVVYMAVPRLRDRRCFIELDPQRLEGDDLRRAGTIKGAFRLGRLVKFSEMQPVDLIVAGSVAVNRRGERVGKGGGYSDLEYALGWAFNLISQKTPVVTTVHPLQILDEPIPMLEHDIPVDILITPDEVVETDHSIPRPGGIYWHLLTEDKISTIPILQQLRP